MPANIINLAGDYSSKSLMEYLITSPPRPKPKIPKGGHNHPKTEIVDSKADTPTASSTFRRPGVVDSHTDYNMIDSILIKTEPGVVELTKDSILDFPSRFPLHLLDSIPEDPTSSSLHRLPPEIRLIVHSYVLTAPPDATLRIRDEPPLTQRFPIFDVTAIIWTSEEICTEARAVFYSTNRFHHDMDEPFFRWPTPFFVNLPFMRHASLSYTDGYPASLAPNEKFAHSIDRALGSLIAELPELATNLRTFNLYVLSIPGLRGSVRKGFDARRYPYSYSSPKSKTPG